MLKLKPWQSRILALLLVTVTMGAVLIFACGGLGKLASSYLPATWYFALIEWKNGDSQATNRRPASMDDLRGLKRVWICLVIGQSNGGNDCSVRTASHQDRVYFLHKNQLTHALDPLPGSTGAGGSLWPTVGDLVIKGNHTDCIVFVGCSVGGTLIEDWVPGGRLNCLITAKLRNLRRLGLEPTHVLWHQGESDTVNGTTGLDYHRSLLQVIQSIRGQDVKCPIFIAQATHAFDRESSPIREAQKSVVSQQNAIFAGPNTDTLGPDFRFDGVHWNEVGQKRAAELWADCLIQR